MRLILTGGFLGSGKTTAIVCAAELLIQQRKKVAVITNDQGEQQVDTEFVRTSGIAAREVLNGCFCCNYQQLHEHLESLHDCDIVFAESVGSCTDLIATVAKPLHQARPDIEVVISIFADAKLLADIIAGNEHFQDESVRYIYKKQLEEADILILNKSDLLTTDELLGIAEIIKAEYPHNVILHQNSFDEDDVGRWLIAVDNFTNHYRNSLDIDYDVYAAGESKLAWLDKNIMIETPLMNAIFVAEKIIGSIADRLQLQHIPIGHLKFFLESEEYKTKISLTRTSTSVNLNLKKFDSKTVRMLINARVETAPAILKNIVDDVLEAAEQTFGCKIIAGKWSAFQPGYPRPAHRITH